MANPDGWSVAIECAKEAIAVAQASGINLEAGDPIDHIRNLGEKIPNARPSMLIDHAAGQRGEVDAINGAISRLGRAVGIPTPPVHALVVCYGSKEPCNISSSELMSF